MSPQKDPIAALSTKKRLPKAWLLGGGLLVVILAGWQARHLLGVPYPNDVPAVTYTALQEAEIYEVVSLDPTNALRVEGDPEAPPGNNFHGYRELGRVAITDPAVRKRLNEALQEGARANTGMAALCFDPRHGIHLVHGGKETDLVICFHCLQVQVHGEGEGFLSMGSPEPVFDDVLTKAGVPLAAKAK